MDTYMLWFDLEPAKTPLDEKVRKAATYFEGKHGKKANLCLVHSSMMPADAGKGIQVDGITVRSWKSVVKSHFLIGVEDGTALAQPAAVAEGEK